VGVGEASIGEAGEAGVGVGGLEGEETFVGQAELGRVAEAMGEDLGGGWVAGGGLRQGPDLGLLAGVGLRAAASGFSDQALIGKLREASGNLVIEHADYLRDFEEGKGAAVAQEG
jgi:hypothetical protein